VNFSLQENPRTARQVQFNVVIRASLARPHTKWYLILGSFSMEWEGDEGNEPVPAWTCNPVFMRRKPRSASDYQSHNGVHTRIITFRYVCSIWISCWLSIELHGGRLASFSHLVRCFLTWASLQKGKGHSQCPENGTCEDAKCRQGNKCWNLDTVQELVQNKCLAVLYYPRDR